VGHLLAVIAGMGVLLVACGWAMTNHDWRGLIGGLAALVLTVNVGRLLANVASAASVVVTRELMKVRAVGWIWPAARLKRARVRDVNEVRLSDEPEWALCINFVDGSSRRFGRYVNPDVHGTIAAINGALRETQGER
jgi:hypothetical protein